ncbi:MAG TPA: hypothetical protein VKT29_02015 [Terriglobales bacterium]|nr:hypothetical protein [Terriglobales bacterium]
MPAATWFLPNVDYGRKLVHSALEGARSGEQTFLQGKTFHLFVDQSAWQALKPAAFAACIGALGAYSGRRHRSRGRALAYGLLGGTIGFGLSLVWQSRNLTSSVASCAWKRVSRTRDEHWLEKNPIDYA